MMLYLVVTALGQCRGVVKCNDEINEQMYILRKHVDTHMN